MVLAYTGFDDILKFHIVVIAVSITDNTAYKIHATHIANGIMWYPRNRKRIPYPLCYIDKKRLLFQLYYKLS